MTSRNRSGNTVNADVSPDWQSGSRPTRLPLQKNNIRIRDAKRSDAPELAMLMCELGYETRPVEMEARLKLILSNPSYKTFVAVMDGCICGMIGTLTYPSYEHNDPSGRILRPGDIEHSAPPRNWPRVDCNCGERFWSKRNQACCFGYTAYSRSSTQVLRVAGLRAKRVAICEATSGKQLTDTRCGEVAALLRWQQ